MVYAPYLVLGCSSFFAGTYLNSTIRQLKSQMELTLYLIVVIANHLAFKQARPGRLAWAFGLSLPIRNQRQEHAQDMHMCTLGYFFAFVPGAKITPTGLRLGNYMFKLGWNNIRIQAQVLDLLSTGFCLTCSWRAARRWKFSACKMAPFRYDREKNGSG